MHTLFASLLLAAFAVAATAADSRTKRYLYLSTPDAAQKGGSGAGILVFDIEDGHRFVRRMGGHGWICFSLDGKYAWSHTPDVVDVRTKRIVATLKDEKGELVSGSKFFEAHFRDGKLVRVGNQFGIGRLQEN